MDTVDANRVQVWQALSELFQDTEVSDTTYEWVAQRISQSGYTLPSVAEHSVEQGLPGSPRQSEVHRGRVGRMD